MTEPESKRIYPLDRRSTKNVIQHKQNFAWGKEALANKDSLSYGEQLALCEEALRSAEMENARLRSALFVVSNLMKQVYKEDLTVAQMAEVISTFGDIAHTMDAPPVGIVVLDFGCPELATVFRNLFESWGEAELAACSEKDNMGSHPHGYIYPFRPADDSEPCDFVYIKATYFN